MDKVIINIESQCNHRVDVLDLKEPVEPTVKHIATYSDGTTAEISQEVADAFADGIARGIASFEDEEKKHTVLHYSGKQEPIEGKLPNPNVMEIVFAEPIPVKMREDFNVTQEATTAPNEHEMREASVPTPQTLEDLTTYINGLVNRPHDYGTCVYAVSMAATAAMQYVYDKLGMTGFQASCADLDIVRRNRHIQGPFAIIKAEDSLFPQYDKRIKEIQDGWHDWLVKEAKKKIQEHENDPTSTVHPRVWDRWAEWAEKPLIREVQEQQKTQAEEKITQVSPEQGESARYERVERYLDFEDIPLVEIYEPEEFEHFDALDISIMGVQSKSLDEILAAHGWKQEEIIGQLPMISPVRRLVRLKKPTPHDEMRLCSLWDEVLGRPHGPLSEGEMILSIGQVELNDKTKEMPSGTPWPVRLDAFLRKKGFSLDDIRRMLPITTSAVELVIKKPTPPNDNA